MSPSSIAVLTVLANPKAGRLPGLEEEVQKAFAALGVEARILSLSPSELRRAARQAAERGEPVLAVYGGDGTHSLAASALEGSDTVLAPLPGGTVNTFARRLGIEDIESAARAVAQGQRHTVPVGRVGEHTFVSTATFGEYAPVVRRRERLRRWLPKWPAAAVAFVLTVTRLRHLEVALELESGGDRATLRRRTPLVWVGLGPGSFPLPQLAPPLVGSPPLELAILRPASRLRMATLLLRFPVRMLVGDAARASPDFEILHLPRFRLRCRHRVAATLDGEPLDLLPPLDVEVLSGRLEVVGACPRQPPSPE